MRVKDFINRAIDEFKIEWCMDTCNNKDGYYVRCKRFGTRAHFTLKAIENNNWGILKSGITQGKNVSHMTRIVGYYSKVENWNKSKLSELKDRHKGNYGI